ncbi:hypothetical protein GCM10012287_37490 [Streptomyces daqingensis]|uniref:Uncharacterized protein n=1 Tax=Streptomyces daqingensis TaxID=1472640 RepID=A0ABQ2MJB3_9ACTN|nr:hypothetical protein GCM10012287_37490 [Streptomyces daqingensis]
MKPAPPLGRGRPRRLSSQHGLMWTVPTLPPATDSGLRRAGPAAPAGPGRAPPRGRLRYGRDSAPPSVRSPARPGRVLAEMVK